MSTRLLVFAGSTRQQSHNRKLAHVAAQMARDQRAAVTHLELSDLDIPLYNADLEARGLRSLEQLTPIILNSQCWLAPKRYSLASAAQAFDEQGQLIDPKQREAVQAVVQQVLWAAPRLHVPAFA